MRALVIGGAGFIGSHLVEALKARGDEVCVIDRAVPLTLFTSRWPCDVVYHLAACGDIRPQADAEHIQDTFLSTEAALSVASAAGASHFIFTSSGAVYGDGELPISVYGACKLGAEGLINAWRERTRKKISILRLGNVVGPKCRGVIPDLLRKLKADPTKLEVCGDGSARKPFIHVSDLVNVLLDPPEGVADIGPPNNTPVALIVEMCLRTALEPPGMTGDMERGCVTQWGRDPQGWVGDIVEPTARSTPWYGATMTSDEAVKRAIKEVWEGMQ